LILASSGGTARSVDGRCTAVIPARAVQNDSYVLVFERTWGPSEKEPRRCAGTIYDVSPAGLAVDGFIEVAIAYPDTVDEPSHLCIARPENGRLVPLESYLDTESRKVITYADELGSFGLLWSQDIETPAYGAGDLVVLQNVPNPFSGSTTIRFEVPRPGRLRAEVISIDGRLVRSLFDASVIPGRHGLQWDGCDTGGSRVASGVYFYRVTYESRTVTNKMVHLR
jgi:hypothetical protein